MHSTAFFKTKTSTTLPRLNSIKKYANIKNMSSPNFDMNNFELVEFFELSFEALDRLYKTDRPRVVGAVLNNSFPKG